jgi:fructose-1,6-bisphosphatase I
MITLDEFTIQQLRAFPHATGELSELLRNIGRAAKRVNNEVNKTGLGDILGSANALNVQGEEVKKLDLFANNQFMRVLQQGISCAGIASEEMDDFIAFDDGISRQSKYVCMFDPLDGSANIDTNISIGTIFGIYLRISAVGTTVTAADFLQPGKNQVAAGYIIYGSSTMFVYATRRGVNGFTLDPSIGEYCMSHPGIKCPLDGQIYSVNHGHFYRYPIGVQQYITRCQQNNYTQRCTGCMVADLHRNLLKGGIFMYPGSTDRPLGKLRLLYECNPFAFILEAAGGVATSGAERILNIAPVSLHQRSPLFIGSKNMMAELAGFLSQKEDIHSYR